MSKNMYTLKADSYDQILQAVPELIEAYKKYGILVIKGHSFSEEEHKEDSIDD